MKTDGKYGKGTNERKAVKRALRSEIYQAMRAKLLAAEQLAVGLPKKIKELELRLQGHKDLEEKYTLANKENLAYIDELTKLQTENKKLAGAHEEQSKLIEALNARLKQVTEINDSLQAGIIEEIKDETTAKAAA